jgi:glycosyltransferase involved in cell wall biosynthesis
MAAKVDGVDEGFFNTEVKPLIDDKQIVFLGEVGHDQKVELLGNSKGLIAPIQWEEPFGLYFIEAMACGAPVITMKKGSAPELIIDGKTGFLCETLEKAVQAVGQIDSLDRQDSFNHAQKNFSSEKMTNDYVNVYKKIMQK